MQATVRMALVNQFKDRLREGNTVTLQRYSLGEIQPKFRIVANPLRLSFLSNTECAECSDFTGSKHGFLFRPFKTIVELKKEEDGQFDVIGRVIACEDLDNYDKNGRAGKKKPLTLIDAEGTELRCTLWGVYAQQFSDFLNKCDDHGKIIVVVQLAMTKIWDGNVADLESQTDENTTPQNVSKNGNADIDKSPSGTISQEKRKADEVEKTVLAYEEENTTSSKVADVTPFDLEPQTDENTTPQNVLKNGNADIDKSPSGTIAQEKRKADEVEKTVLAYEE
ncbi:replication protein A 70 kDa DNA-binding subunit D [Artemisia annua]|uniref:Replication protein A 70 kDa DNA-binding subunit D n=1 Tax=Artemisia annua TaxID=35608 RepID=A0A2U1NHS5_ARTAN|nr:replication protein A 70 kDa DNA-binding subunit D [Artemisia annua]